MNFQHFYASFLQYLLIIFYSYNLATPAPKPCLLLCLPLPSIKFPHYLCTVIQSTVCYRLGVQLARNFNDLNTALDMKNNLGRNVLALFDPPHLSKLGKFFITRICAKPKRDSVTRYSRKMCVRVVNGIVNSNNLKI